MNAVKRIRRRVTVIKTPKRKCGCFGGCAKEILENKNFKCEDEK